MAENELQTLINGIFNRIKEKYGYTDEQALIYLKGYEDCAEEHQQSLEKRDRMLRDTVEELCEVKRLLKLSLEQNNPKCKYCIHDLKEEQPNYNPCCTGETANCKWIHADEVDALLKK